MRRLAILIAAALLLLIGAGVRRGAAAEGKKKLSPAAQRKKLLAEKTKREAEIARLDKQLASNKKKQEALLAAIEAGMDTKLVATRAAKLKTEVASIEKKRAPRIKRLVAIEKELKSPELMTMEERIASLEKQLAEARKGPSPAARNPGTAKISRSKPKGEGEPKEKKGLWADIWEREQLLGNIFGAREAMADRGLSVEMVYTGEGFVKARGGLNTHSTTEYRGDASILLELDTEAAGWWKNGTFFMHLQEEHGHGITEEHVGDFATLSNIDADDFKQISEFWYLHKFMEGQLWVKFGKMDATADFAAPKYGGEFLNSSPGFHPSIPMVTYPDPDMGVVVGVEPAEWFSMNMGVYQARPDGGRPPSEVFDSGHGLMVMFEPAFHYQLGGRAGHLRVGVWMNGDEFDELAEDNPAPGIFRESYGWYLTWDHQLWLENPKKEDDEQGIGVFFQYGWAPKDRSEAAEYVGGGAQWTGALPSRDSDVLGLGVFHVIFSDEAGFEEGSETTIEFYYKLQLTGWMSIKPDVQYIRNPGGTSNDDAVAVGVRVEVSF